MFPIAPSRELPKQAIHKENDPDPGRMRFGLALAIVPAGSEIRPSAGSFHTRKRGAGFHRGEENIMLYWTLAFLVIALLAALLGFSGIAVAAAGVAKILFYLFLVLFLVGLVMHLARRA